MCKERKRERETNDASGISLSVVRHGLRTMRQPAALLQGDVYSKEFFFKEQAVKIQENFELI